MFKFRRSSLCSNPEVVANNSSSDDEQKSFSLKKGSLRNSISESRLASTTNDSPDEKESLSDSSVDSVVNSFGTKKSTDPYKTIVVAADTEIIFEKCRVNANKAGVGDSTTSNSVTMMPDRKRKERHESSSQEQETKVIRGNDPEAPTTETYDGKIKSCDTNANDINEFIGNEMHDGGLTLAPKPIPCTAPQVGYGMRTMPMDFEPETQRQLERTAAQWNVRKGRRSRSRYSVRTTKSCSEIEVDDVAGNGNCQSPKLEEDCTLENDQVSSKMESQPKEQKSFNPTIEIGSDEDLDLDESEIPKDLDNLAPLPPLDLSTLHQSIDSHEPVSAFRLSYSSDQAMLSPRNHSLIKSGVGSHAPNPPLHQSPVHPPVNRQVLDETDQKYEARINFLLRQVGNFKKQIKMLEAEYEQIYGHKPSQTDRQNNKDMRKCMLLLARSKRELQAAREDPGNQNGNANSLAGSTLGTRKMRGFGVFISRSKSVSDETLKQLETLVEQIQRTLDDNRKAYKRPDDPLLMTQQELVNEKNSMQKQLLVLERKFGRPETKEEKEVVKVLYNRYRLVKKLSFRFSAERENSFDLVPIFEHETLEFAEGSGGETGQQPGIPEIKMNFAADHGESIDLNSEDFNEMSLCQLESKHKVVSVEKKRLRSILRKFETDFQATTGRLPQKEDKYSSNEMELLYQKYKHFKANAKLLDVLISKKKFPFSRADLGKVED